jgi:hypothetical protein
MRRMRISGAALAALAIVCWVHPALAQYYPPPPGYQPPPPEYQPPQGYQPPPGYQPAPPPEWAGEERYGVRLEWNTDRPGEDYTHFDMAEPRPHQCAYACRKDRHCHSFSFMKPGVQGPYASCWLKHVAPAPVPNGCCVSGVLR